MIADGKRNCGRRHLRRHDGGFTLIEIVVALAVLGGVMFVLLETHFRALQVYESARDKVTIRNFVAQAVGRAETEVLAGNLAGDGDFGERYPDYSYTFEAQQMGEGNVLLFDVLVTVEDPEGEKHDIVFLVYDPRMMGGMAAGEGAGVTSPRDLSGASGMSGIDLSDLSSRASGIASRAGQ
ncbi:MAG: prepilin-type N-terminal cleavage/methylation domain-containing protein [Candidatus Hydrogenedentota bacterium]